MSRSPLNRLSSALLFSAAIAMSAGCGSSDGGDDDGIVGPPFANPPEVSSSDGLLSTTLTVMPAVLTVADEEVTFLSLYNGLYIPPVLRTQPGDQIEILLRNYGINPTNLHYHGLSVTPQGAGDNIYISVSEGDSFMNSFPIPLHHAQGMFWYHPHRDPYLNQQISGGMSGAMIIGDVLAPFPSLADVPERIMILKDLKTVDGYPEPDPDPAGPTVRTINGLYMPTIPMQPGKAEFWRVGNQSSNIFYEITLDGLSFHILAVDGNLQNRVITVETLFLPPGSRLEGIVYGPAPGTYEMQALDFNTGPDGDAYPGQLMATIESEGDAVQPIPLPTDFPPIVDMTTLPLTGTKTVVFDDTPNPDQFIIDGKPFSPNCIDYVVMLGSTEEWTIENAATEAHVFHIHQLDFQVTEVNGVPKPFTGYQDVVTLPPAIDENTPSVVKMIIPFTDPVMVGEFVYHCHIIQHEDQGMMASIFVQDPQGPPPDSPLCQ